MHSPHIGTTVGIAILGLDFRVWACYVLLRHYVPQIWGTWIDTEFPPSQVLLISLGLRIPQAWDLELPLQGFRVWRLRDHDVFNARKKSDLLEEFEEGLEWCPCSGSLNHC